MTAAYPIPAWRVSLDGTDLTARMAPRLLELTLEEARGDEADQLDIRIHDHDGRMAIPARGAVLQVAIGWAGSGLVDKGQFTVDEVEHSGSPDIISIRARSADFTKAMRTRKEKSWHKTTLGAILKAIAGKHGLKAKIDAALAAIKISHLDQTNESDVHFLTRLAKRFDAIATVKAGALLFSPVGKGQTADGTPLPDVTLARRDGDQHRYSIAGRDSYTGVRAFWADKKGATQHDVLVGDDENAKRLPGTYHSEQEAREQAEAANKRIQRGSATMSYTMALGRADLYPEQRATVTGFKPEIDATEWLIVKARHQITGSGGFTTQVELETALDGPGDDSQPEG
ncbi:phage late control D family protein [Thermomonas sp.]|uniref:phage late control D family protein n=1 Tax=Thermomonas sp. TaxID=1971895 RepID=UPI0035B01C8F